MDNAKASLIWMDLMYCLGELDSDLYTSFLSKPSSTLTQDDMLEITTELMKGINHQSSIIRAKNATIIALTGELDRATTSVSMFESAISDYKSGRSTY